MRCSTDQRNLIKSPVYGIPIGESIRLKTGRYVLRIKKAASSKIEDVPLDTLISIIIKEAKVEQEQSDSSSKPP